MPNTRVSELMSKDPVTLPADALLRQAVELDIVRRIRHIPILGGDGRLVGIVTDRDLKRVLPSPLSFVASEEYERILDTTPVSQVMTREPCTIEAGAPVVDALRVMIERRVGGLPVLDDGRVVGIITEKDMLRGYLRLLSA
jgi:acetoin utilization protein AcuB